MTREELLKVLKEIRDGKDGQMIPYNLILHGINPIRERGCLENVIYLLENTSEEGET